MKNLISEIKWKLVGILGKILIDLIFSSSKITILGFEKAELFLNSRKWIGAVWHSRMLMASYLYKGWNAAILVSQSDDGEIIARILQKQGNDTIRGSSTRGGLRALAMLIKRIKADQPGVIIPDGPQGPRLKVQSGIITLAKKTGAPILPMTYSARHAKIFSSWDRFMLPYPFTQCVVIYGNPIYVPENADFSTHEQCRLALEKELLKITIKADTYVGRVTL